MKKILFLFLLLLPFITSAQFGINASPKLLVNTTSFRNSGVFEKKTGVAFDFLVDYKFDFGLKLSSGVDYTNYRFSGNENGVLEFPSSSDPIISYNLVSIPIYADYYYYKGEKIKPYLGAGILFGINAKERVKYSNNEKYNFNRDKQNFLAVRVGFDYFLTNHVFVGAIATYNISLKDMDSQISQNQSKLKSITVGATVGYRF